MAEEQLSVEREKANIALAYVLDQKLAVVIKNYIVALEEHNATLKVAVTALQEFKWKYEELCK